MATLLDKDLVRESSIKVDNREIVLTIGADQSITMKLKGMKTGAVTISVEDLYKQLVWGIDDEKPKSVIVPTGGVKKHSSDPMMSLHDIRHRLNVSAFDYSTTVKFDGIMNDLIEEQKKL